MTPSPLLALTVGDPAGIGPEIVVGLLREGIPPGVRLLIVGDRGSLARAAGGGARDVLPPSVAGTDAMAGEGLAVGLLETLPAPLELPEPGRIDARAGAACHAWVLDAAALALAGEVDGIVTGPIHKEAWRRAGIESPGHTEALREAAGVDRVLMLLVGGRLRAALATIHVALRDVPDLLETPRLVGDLELLARELRETFGVENPRIAVAGLNPHAGEGGLFGREERDVIQPAVEAVRGRGIDAEGPLPADACIPAAVHGAWDAVYAMYHDQALPTVKAIAPRHAVNVTLGLPFVRTSVDHGTAFDIVGTGRAKPTSLGAAVELGTQLAMRRRSARRN